MIARWTRPLPALLEPAVPLDLAGPQGPRAPGSPGTPTSGTASALPLSRTRAPGSTRPWGSAGARSTVEAPTTLRRSAAEGRAVIPPRSATADTIRRTPVTPHVAAPGSTSAHGSRTPAAAGLAGTADLPRTLRRLVEAEAAGASTSRSSVRDLIRQYDSGGRPSPLTSQEGVAMSLPTFGAAGPPPVPASAMAFGREQLEGDRDRAWDPTDPKVLDTIVDRVVERIEDRVVEELERRGRRRIPGVF